MVLLFSFLILTVFQGEFIKMQKPQTLKEWQRVFFLIYGERNTELYQPSDVLLHIVEEMAELAEALRKEHRAEVITNLPDVFAWLSSFCNIVAIDLEKAVWYKYPNLCPYCFQKKHCVCIAEELKYQADKGQLEKYRERKEEMPLTLDAWQKMFERIYGRVNKIKFQVQIWFHLWEEIGEVSKAFRLHQRKELEEELADCFAWLLAVSTKLQVSLAELTWQTYPGTCRVCHKERCQCPVV